jgi:hypothetical protein
VAEELAASQRRLFSMEVVKPPNFSTFDHYYSMDSFSVVRCVLSRKYPKITPRSSYYLIENQGFKEAGFFIPKIEGGLKFLIYLNAFTTEW